MTGENLTQLEQRFIVQLEAIINGANERVAGLEQDIEDRTRKLREEIDQVNREAGEARLLLHKLKGTSPTERPKRHQVRPEDYIDALEQFDDEFTTADLSELVEVSKAAAAQWLRSHPTHAKRVNQPAPGVEGLWKRL